MPTGQPHYTLARTGIALRRTREAIARFGGHAQAKADLQRACFGENGVRPDVPLLCYLGRIAHQKVSTPPHSLISFHFHESYCVHFHECDFQMTFPQGLHLLLECFPALFAHSNGQIHLLVCGKADLADPYAAHCAAAASRLRAAYPQVFW